ncbi:MAG: amidase family protein, partial [Geminicoccaceae bacterium]
TAPIAHQGLLNAAQSNPPLAPLFAFAKTPVWDQAEDSTKDAFAELADFLGDAVDHVDLPEVFAQGHALQKRLMTVGFAHNLGRFEQRGREQLSEQMRDAIDQGREVRAHDYLAAVDWIEVLNAGLDRIFERYDAILTPSAPGAAPESTTTGNPAFCTLWTLLGTPAITLPLLNDESGLPLGVQLIGPRGGDARLMRTAAWLTDAVKTA